MMFFHKNYLTKIDQSQSTISISEDYLPVISVVMPSFNQAKYIERSILSVINQNYPRTQLIIIDGMSTDNTGDILEKYDEYIYFRVSEPDNGQSDALNKGFSIASGEIFCWLNSDDIFMPHTFFNVVEAFQLSPQKSICYGDWLSIDENDNILDTNHAFNFSLNHFKYEGFHLNAQSMFWHSKIHKDFSGFDIQLNYTMDYQMILEFGIRFENSFHRIPKILGAFRRYDGQKTQSLNSKVLYEHMYLANKYGYQDKYTYIGKYKRLIFRFRRFYWYLRRGGVKVLLKRLLIAIKNAKK